MSTRKKPGRPRKRADVSPIGQLGVVADPSDQRNCVELIYNQPQLFKCIVSIFKEYNCDNVIIEFRPQSITFVGCDGSHLVNIHIEVKAQDMNAYYFTPPEVLAAPLSSSAALASSSFMGAAASAAAASSSHAPLRDDDTVDRIDEDEADDEADDADDRADDEADEGGEEEDFAEDKEVAEDSCKDSKARESEEREECEDGEALILDDGPLYRIVIKRDNLDAVSAIIEKTHYKMAIFLRRDDLSSLFIMLSSCEYDNEDLFEIGIVPGAQKMPLFEIPKLEDFPLEFTLDSHHLRRKISELKKVSLNVMIKKAGNSDLEIIFGSIPRVVYTASYRTASKIKLRSDFAATETFVATLNVHRIRPLMAVNMPGGITFFANRTDPLVIQVGLDQRADSHFAIVARLFIKTTTI